MITSSRTLSSAGMTLLTKPLKRTLAVVASCLLRSRMSWLSLWPCRCRTSWKTAFLISRITWSSSSMAAWIRLRACGVPGQSGGAFQAQPGGEDPPDDRVLQLSGDTIPLADDRQVISVVWQCGAGGGFGRAGQARSWLACGRRLSLAAAADPAARVVCQPPSFACRVPVGRFTHAPQALGAMRMLAGQPVDSVRDLIVGLGGCRGQRAELCPHVLCGDLTLRA